MRPGAQPVTPRTTTTTIAMLQGRLFSSAKILAPLFNTPIAGHGSSSCRVTKKLWNTVEVQPNRNYCNQFCTCSADKDLLSKKCVPCHSKDVRAMSEQSANELITKVPGWNLLSEGGTLKLQRAMKVKSFLKGLELFKTVGDVAEAEGHHPDLHLVGWNNVKIEIWTHSAGGLTENDFILAAKINSLDLEHFLRRKAAI